VRLGVVADEVAGGVDATDDLGTLADEAADHEEGGAGVVEGEEVEESVGGDVVGAVVVGERGLVGVVAGDDGVAEELRAGAEGCVGEREAGGGYESRSCQRCFGGRRGEKRAGHAYFFSSARTSSAWPSGLTLLKTWMSFWSGPMT